MKETVLKAAALLLILLLPFSALARDTAAGKLLHVGELPYSPEFSEVIDCVADILRLSEAEAEKVGVADLPESLPFYKAAKAYTLSSPCAEEELFALAETDEYVWKMPVARETGVIYASISVKAGRVTGYCAESAESLSACGQVLYLFEGSAVESSLDSSGLKADSGALFSIPDIGLDFAAFRSGGKAYALPFFDGEALPGIQSGEICTLEKLMAAFASLRGVPVPGAEASFPLWIPAAAGAALLLALGLTAAFRRRAKKGMK